ncbi:MAG TPA: hypothetical protein VJO99_26375 [Burkholderiaceae bacterium]|nr:hypothetical protein [Burkholderiaceae bacterium]
MICASGKRILDYGAKRSSASAIHRSLSETAKALAAMILSGRVCSGAPDEIKNERHNFARVSLEQQVAGVEDMGLHSRQILHP